MTTTPTSGAADLPESLRASHGQAPAQPVDFTTLGAAMRAIQQAIELIGTPTDERMRAVRRVLRGVVIVAEDSGYIPAQPDCLTCSDHGAAYAALPDEREMLKHALWLASSFTVHRYLMSNAEGRWSGAEKATCHDELCRLYVAVFRGVEVDQVRVDLEADWMAVHDATQELTDHMDVVIGFPLKGVPDYEVLAPKFFAYFHRLAAHALRASHEQASSQAGEYPALVCDYCGALTPDPWHSSGMLHGKMSKHIHSCDACAALGVAKAQAAKQQEQLI